LREKKKKKGNAIIIRNKPGEKGTSATGVEEGEQTERRKYTKGGKKKGAA